MGRGEPPPGRHARTVASTYTIVAPYITRAPTPCSTSPWDEDNSSPAVTAWKKRAKVCRAIATCTNVSLRC